MTGYRIRIVLLSLGVVLGFGSAIMHFTHGHGHRHCHGYDDSGWNGGDRRDHENRPAATPKPGT